jgi:hypothetical protein
MARGGDTSWLGAGGTQNDYNPFGQIYSGVVGQYDPFGGYQAQPNFNDRFGAATSGAFDGSAGTFNNRFPSVFPSSSVGSDQVEFMRQNELRMIQEFLNGSYPPAYDPLTAPDVPSTLLPMDYYTTSRGGP